MRDPLRPVAVAPQLMDAIDNPPDKGAKVLALGLGGVLTQTVWTSDSHLFFVAWMPYPKVSPAIRQRLRTQLDATIRNTIEYNTTEHNNSQQ